MLCCWHHAAVLCSWYFPHIPWVWVISVRKCPIISAKTFHFTTLFLFLLPLILTPRPWVGLQISPHSRLAASIHRWLPKMLCLLEDFPTAQLLLSLWLLVLLAKSWMSSLELPFPLLSPWFESTRQKQLQLKVCLSRSEGRAGRIP